MLDIEGLRICPASQQQLYDNMMAARRSAVKGLCPVFVDRAHVAAMAKQHTDDANVSPPRSQMQRLRAATIRRLVGGLGVRVPTQEQLHGLAVASLCSQMQRRMALLARCVRINAPRDQQVDDVPSAALRSCMQDVRIGRSGDASGLDAVGAARPKRQEAVQGIGITEDTSNLSQWATQLLRLECPLRDRAVLADEWQACQGAAAPE
mmetsp:Transcript_49333/g.159278  ORF Transcript_49333/g.159278 Transcript_49333/m.159278 type:complete len:207 (-) Transcript_49333:873-1493(-)